MRSAALLTLLLLAACSGGDEQPAGEQRDSGPARLLFAAKGDNGSWDVYVEDVVSGRRTNLTRTPGRGRVEADDTSPARSPDGARIAYASTADHVSDGAVDQEIFVMESDGSDPRRLTTDDDADLQPQWSPEGRILFTTCPSSQEAILACRLEAISPDGSGRETVVDDLGLAYGVVLSPDGRRIAYARYDETLQPLGFFVRELGSTDEVGIADEGGGGQWSPDGSQIAFLSDRDRNGSCRFHECVGHAPELYVVDEDGSKERRLTETTAIEGFASWTPDGEWILISRIGDEEDDYDIFAVRADGSCEVQVTNTEAWEWSASWSGSTEPLDC